MSHLNFSDQRPRAVSTLLIVLVFLASITSALSSSALFAVEQTKSADQLAKEAAEKYLAYLRALTNNSASVK